MWFWRTSSASEYYGWWAQRSDALFLRLARRRVRTKANMRPRAGELFLEPLAHHGLFRARDGRSFRCFVPLKNAYTSSVDMLVATQNCATRYGNYQKWKKMPTFQDNNAVKRQTISILGRTETVQYPPPWAHTFYPESAFSKHPNAEVRIAVVRDPVERFLSFYRGHVLFYHKLWKAGERNWAPYKTRHALSDFLQRVEKGWPHKPWLRSEPLAEEGFARDKHCWPQTFFLGHDASYFTHIFSTNRMQDFADLLSELSGQIIELPRSNVTTDVPYPTVTKAIRQRLERLYKDDYKVFGKHFD